MLLRYSSSSRSPGMFQMCYLWYNIFSCPDHVYDPHSKRSSSRSSISVGRAMIDISGAEVFERAQRRKIGSSPAEEHYFCLPPSNNSTGYPHPPPPNLAVVYCLHERFDWHFASVIGSNARIYMATVFRFYSAQINLTKTASLVEGPAATIRHVHTVTTSTSLSFNRETPSMVMPDPSEPLPPYTPPQALSLSPSSD